MRTIILPAVAALALGLQGCTADPATTAPTSDVPTTALAATALTFRHVSAGGDFSCGVTSDDLAYCWGDNFYGQLGDGSVGSRATPAPVQGGLRFRDVAVGAAHACGITTENRAYCWGYNNQGQLGIGSSDGPETCFLHFSCSTRPLAVAGTRRFDQIVVGGGHSCAITLADRPFCWGDNSGGQLGDGTSLERHAPVAVKGSLTVGGVAAGFHHSCAVTTDSRLFCWGYNFEGQLGDGTKTKRQTPTAVAGGRSWRQVSGGSSHTCGVTTGNVAYCWGWNYKGQLGSGTVYPDFPRRLKPFAVLGGLRFARVSAAYLHTCGVTTDSRGYCWGDNQYGQLGDGSLQTQPVPVPVAGNRLFTEVRPGVSASHSCGVTASGGAFCWGVNGDGQLGNGTGDPSSVPVAVVDPT